MPSLQEIGRYIIGESAVKLMGFNPEVETPIARGHDSEVYRLGGKTAVKVYKEHVGLWKLSDYQKATSKAGRVIDGRRAVFDNLGIDLGGVWRVNPIRFVGMMNVRGRKAAYSVSDFIEGEKMRESRLFEGVGEIEIEAITRIIGLEIGEKIGATGIFPDIPNVMVEKQGEVYGLVITDLCARLKRFMLR